MAAEECYEVILDFLDRAGLKRTAKVMHAELKQSEGFVPEKKRREKLLRLIQSTNEKNQRAKPLTLMSQSKLNRQSRSNLNNANTV